jgi:hypothetical protein
MVRFITRVSTIVCSSSGADMRFIFYSVNLYCHDLGVCGYRRGMKWWIRFIDHLYTPLGTTSNYSAVADLHTLYISAAAAKSYPNLLCLQRPFPINGF